MKRIHNSTRLAIYRHADKLGRAVYYVGHPYPKKRRIAWDTAVMLSMADAVGKLDFSMIREAVNG